MNSDLDLDSDKDMDKVPLWEASPSRKASTQMQEYLDFLDKSVSSSSSYSYKELHQWSVERPDLFWTSLIRYFTPLYQGDLQPAFDGERNQFLNYSWFPGVRLNFAQNLLSQKSWEKEDRKNKAAISFIHETGLRKTLTYGDLWGQVGKLQRYLRSLWEGEGKGQVLAAYMPNIPETVISMLGASSLGGIFSSTSCDFGVEGVVDRFGQIRPSVLVAAAGYTYNGKFFDQREKIREIQQRLPELKKVIVVDFLGKIPPGEKLWEGAVSWEEIMTADSAATLNPLLTYTQVPFSSPLYIMYSSGTTGKPKCITHSVGGTLLQHIKELGLHSDLRPNKKIFYFTTCGWMMWNWLVSGLYFGSTLVLFEGSPVHPDPLILIRLIRDEGINIFGTSPKFLRALEGVLSPTSPLPPLPSLETVLSTGSPLLPEQFDFVYGQIKKDVHLASICGGTDIIGCFMLGNPLLPVYRGEIQCLGLGLDVAAFSDQGRPLVGEEGELVCRQIFPSMPLGFWGDSREKDLFRKAYFERFPGVWHHGDFVRLSEKGTVRVFGRSDATLNPGGVRIGTAEIYQQTEKFPYILDSLCVGKEIPEGDVEILLFVKMKEGESLTEERKKEIKSLIRQSTTPRHVPAKILAVADIPYTRSGKKMELLIAKILNRQKVTNLAAVANPQCLEEYENLDLKK